MKKLGFLPSKPGRARSRFDLFFVLRAARLLLRVSCFSRFASATKLSPPAPLSSQVLVSTLCFAFFMSALVSHEHPLPDDESDEATFARIRKMKDNA